MINVNLTVGSVPIAYRLKLPEVPSNEHTTVALVNADEGENKVTGFSSFSYESTKFNLVSIFIRNIIHNSMKRSLFHVF